MRQIPIAEAAPGMRLAKPATNLTGQAILGTGLELDAHLIARLQQMGVSVIYVEELPGEKVVGAKPLPELEQELDRRFRKAAGDRTSEMIREAVRRHLYATYAVNPLEEGPRP